MTFSIQTQTCIFALKSSPFCISYFVNAEILWEDKDRRALEVAYRTSPLCDRLEWLEWSRVFIAVVVGLLMQYLEGGN